MAHETMELSRILVLIRASLVFAKYLLGFINIMCNTARTELALVNKLYRKVHLHEIDKCHLITRFGRWTLE